MLEVVVLLLIAAAASYFGVALVRDWALRHQALDVPNQRSSHSRPTPRGGGLAVVLVTILTWLAFSTLFQTQTSRSAVLACGLGASLIAVVGWLDDLYSLSAALRLAVQGLSALIAVCALGYWQSLPFLPGHAATLGPAGAVLTWLWIVGLTNAYNFMDGSDGLAGTQAVIAAVGWACLGWMASSSLVASLSLLLAAASLGFLLHNWPPARIFMGDVGSAFLGYSFAIVPLLGLREPGPIAAAGPILGVLPVWPFVFDAAFTFLRRLRHGENVFAAHRSHLYQRLIIVGHSHRFVLLLYGALAIVGAAAGIVWLALPALSFCGSAVLFPSLAWLLWRFVIAEERRAREAMPAARIGPVSLPERRAA